MKSKSGERIIKKYSAELGVHKGLWGYDYCRNSANITLSNYQLYIEAPERVSDSERTRSKVFYGIAGAALGARGVNTFLKGELGYDYTGGDIEIPFKTIKHIRLKRNAILLLTVVEIEFNDRTIALDFNPFTEMAREFTNNIKRLSGIDS